MPSLSISRLDHANMVLTGLKNNTIRESKFWNKLKRGDPVHIFHRLRVAKKHKPKDYQGNIIHRLTPPDSPAICIGNLPITIKKNGEYEFIHIHQKDDGVFPYLCSEDTKLANDRYGALFIDDLFRLDRFAKMDGFDSWSEMRKFFLNDRERFDGRLIMWKPLNMEPILQYCYTCGRVRPIHLMEQIGDKYECLDKSCGGEILKYKRRKK